MIFVGVDWAEVHHDVCVMDADGNVLARKRIPDSLLGVGELHAVVAEHLGDDDEPSEVIVGIEKDRGLIVTALVAADYQVFAINPLAASLPRASPRLGRQVRSRATPRSWPTWFAPTAATTAWWLATVP